MNEWKLRQHIFHKVFTPEEMGDDLKKEVVIENWQPEKIVEDALRYLTKQSQELYYPGKSYAVAIVYALLLEKEFGPNHIESLNDPDLLFGNDPYFVPYSKSPDIYQNILDSFPRELIDNPYNGSENFQKTHEYFYLEFLLHEKTSIYAPS